MSFDLALAGVVAVGLLVSHVVDLKTPESY